MYTGLPSRIFSEVIATVAATKKEGFIVDDC
jgi:hypothetical protein